MKEYEIKEEAGNRIDKAVSNLDNSLTRVAAKRMIDNGNILVNGNLVKSSYKLNSGDKITVEEEKQADSNINPEDIPLDIIYEDNDILVVNKEKGMVVHPRKWQHGKDTRKCCNGKM
jgi:23S rRNA pseudouridine1911/1915/1917 synthase